MSTPGEPASPMSARSDSANSGTSPGRRPTSAQLKLIARQAAGGLDQRGIPISRALGLNPDTRSGQSGTSSVSRPPMGSVRRPPAEGFTRQIEQAEPSAAIAAEQELKRRRSREGTTESFNPATAQLIKRQRGEVVDDTGDASLPSEMSAMSGPVEDRGTAAAVPASTSAVAPIVTAFEGTSRDGTSVDTAGAGGDGSTSPVGVTTSSARDASLDVLPGTPTSTEAPAYTPASVMERVRNITSRSTQPAASATASEKLATLSSPTESMHSQAGSAATEGAVPPATVPPGIALRTSADDVTPRPVPMEDFSAVAPEETAPLVTAAASSASPEPELESRDIDSAAAPPVEAETAAGTTESAASTGLVSSALAAVGAAIGNTATSIGLADDSWLSRKKEPDSPPPAAAAATAAEPPTQEVIRSGEESDIDEEDEEIEEEYVEELEVPLEGEPLGDASATSYSAQQASSAPAPVGGFVADTSASPAEAPAIAPRETHGLDEPEATADPTGHAAPLAGGGLAAAAIPTGLAASEALPPHGADAAGRQRRVERVVDDEDGSALDENAEVISPGVEEIDDGAEADEDDDEFAAGGVAAEDRDYGAFAAPSMPAPPPASPMPASSPFESAGGELTTGQAVVGGADNDDDAVADEQPLSGTLSQGAGERPLVVDEVQGPAAVLVPVAVPSAAELEEETRNEGLVSDQHAYEEVEDVGYAEDAEEPYGDDEEDIEVLEEIVEEEVESNPVDVDVSPSTSTLVAAPQPQTTVPALDAALNHSAETGAAVLGGTAPLASASGRSPTSPLVDGLSAAQPSAERELSSELAAKLPEEERYVDPVDEAIAGDTPTDTTPVMERETMPEPEAEAVAPASAADGLAAAPLATFVAAPAAAAVGSEAAVHKGSAADAVVAGPSVSVEKEPAVRSSGAEVLSEEPLEEMDDDGEEWGTFDSRPEDADARIANEAVEDRPTEHLVDQGELARAAHAVAPKESDVSHEGRFPAVVTMSDRDLEDSAIGSRAAATVPEQSITRRPRPEFRFNEDSVRFEDADRSVSLRPGSGTLEEAPVDAGRPTRDTSDSLSDAALGLDAEETTARDAKSEKGETKVTPKKSSNVLIILGVVFAVLVGVISVLLGTGMVDIGSLLPKDPCYTGFIQNVDRDVWRVKFGSYKLPVVSDEFVDKCFAVEKPANVTLDNNVYETKSKKNFIVTDLRMREGGTLKGLKLRTSVLNSVWAKGDSVVQKPRLENAIVHQAVFEDAVQVERLQLGSSIIYEWAIGGAASFARPRLSNSLVGGVTLLESVAFHRPLFSNTIFRDIELTGTASIRKAGFSSAEFYDVRVLGAADATRVSLSKCVVDGLYCGGDLHNKVFKMSRSDVSEINVLEGLTMAMTKVMRSVISSVSVGKDATLQKLIVLKSTITEVVVSGALNCYKVKMLEPTLKNIVLGSSVNLLNTNMARLNLHGLDVHSSLFASALRIADAHVELVTFRGSFELSRTRLSNLNLRKAVFNGAAKFDGLSLSKDSVFHNVLFANATSFSSAKLSGLYMRSMVFLGPVSFEKSQMHNVRFEEVTFVGPLNFRGARLSGVTFTRCVFRDVVDFRESKISDVKFPMVSFEADVLYDRKQMGPRIEANVPRSRVQMNSDLRKLVVESGDLVSRSDATLLDA